VTTMSNTSRLKSHTTCVHFNQQSVSVWRLESFKNQHHQYKNQIRLKSHTRSHTWEGIGEDGRRCTRC